MCVNNTYSSNNTEPKSITVSNLPYSGENWSVDFWVNYNNDGEKKMDRGLEPQKIIFNDRTTIVYWNDGTKTKSTCAAVGGDVFDEELGFAMCLLKKMYGKKVYGKKLYKRMVAKAVGHKVEK